MKNKRLTLLALLSLLACFALPALADQHAEEPIPWQDLPADARSLLAPMADHWDQLKPKQQHRLLRKVGNQKFKQGADRWKRLSPEERERLKQSRGRFKQLPPEKRKALRQQWENMSESERKEAIHARQALSDIPPKQHHRLLRELRNLPQEERRAELNKLVNATPQNKGQKDTKPKDKNPNKAE